MITDAATGLHATRYKSIDGLQIRYASNDKLDGGQYSCLAHCRKASSLLSLPGRCSLRTRPGRRR